MATEPDRASPERWGRAFCCSARTGRTQGLRIQSLHHVAPEVGRCAAQTARGQRRMLAEGAACPTVGSNCAMETDVASQRRTAAVPRARPRHGPDTAVCAQSSLDCANMWACTDCADMHGGRARRPPRAVVWPRASVVRRTQPMPLHPSPRPARSRSAAACMHDGHA